MSRLHVFSHKPGVRLLIPGTAVVVEVHPAFIRIGDQAYTVPATFPIKNFTALQDLEKGCVHIFSNQYRYIVMPNGELIEGKRSHLPQLEMQRLTLGMNKQLEWESIYKRCDIREIFPLWLRLGELYRESSSTGPLATLLEECRQAAPDLVSSAFVRLFLAGFKEMMLPSFQPYMGIISGQEESRLPLFLLSEGAQLIKRLFYRFEGATLSILPNCPPECHCGAFSHIDLPGVGQLTFEWSKKKVRKVTLKATHAGELKLNFSGGVRECRREGAFIPVSKPLEFKSGVVYVWDQFKK